MAHEMARRPPVAQPGQQQPRSLDLEVKYLELWRSAVAVLPAWLIPDGVLEQLGDMVTTSVGDEYEDLWNSTYEQIRDEQIRDEGADASAGPDALLLLFIHYCSSCLLYTSDAADE